MSDHLQAEYEYDVFVSHASEDKESFVRPLVGMLVDFGVKVWYDEFSLEVGDSLSRSIDKGLAKSKYGVVVLSKAFLQKAWPEYELRGLTTRQVGHRKVILPIWYGVNKEDVINYSPTLADALALNSDIGLSGIVFSLLKAVRPELHRALQRKQKLSMRQGEIVMLDIREINADIPRVRERLTDEQLVRLRIIKALVGSLDKTPFEVAYDCYLHELYPDRELHIWERASLITALYRTHKPDCSEQEAETVLFAFLSTLDVDIDKAFVDRDYRLKKQQELGIDLDLALTLAANISLHPDVGPDEFASRNDPREKFFLDDDS